MYETWPLTAVIHCRMR